MEKKSFTYVIYCLLFLTISGLFGLNSIPFSDFNDIINNKSLFFLLIKIENLSFLYILLFWSTKPKINHQRKVILLWPISFAILFFLLKNTNDFDKWREYDPYILTLVTISLCFASLIGLVFRIFEKRDNSNLYLINRLKWLLLVIFFFGHLTGPGLQLTVTLHPKTFDLYAMQFDAVANINITSSLTDLINDLWPIHHFLILTYNLTPVIFFAALLNQLRNEENNTPNALWLWIILATIALIGYHFFPIVGPRYIFGNENFVSALRETSKIADYSQIESLGLFPRNGMPSMHFGWVLAANILWWQSNSKYFSRIILLILLISVAIATIYLGEHYVVDLIVAIPIILAAFSIGTTAVNFLIFERWFTIFIGFSCWFIWVISLRTQLDFLISNPWSCWILICFTMVVVILQIKFLRRFKYINIIQTSAVCSSSPKIHHCSLHEQPKIRLGLMFFTSGVAALIYQVLFAKELTLVFGSTATATFTVLATFLGGMAIGSLIGGVLAVRVPRPIVVYAVVELAIAGFCVLTPTLFSGIQSIYVSLAADLPPASPVLLVLRVALGAGVLVVPTVLMGITLPLLAQALNPSGSALGKSVAWLYACNTAGAALGAILTSYFIIPLLGAHSTTLIAALMNLLVALGALELAKSYGLSIDALTNPMASEALSEQKWVGGPLILAGAWLALGLGGVLSLGLEVIYVHMLSIVAGNSVYAFGLMLATFLVGLAIGGETGRRLLERIEIDRSIWLTLSQLGLATSVAVGAWGWDMIPAYFASFAGYPLVTTFQSREAVRALVCALVMIPPTVCIGMSYTLAMDLATTATRRRGITMLGWSAALNTFGNIVGVLLFGFFLLPWLGGLVASKIVAYLAIGVACVTALSIRSVPSRRWVGAVVVCVTGLIAISPTKLDYEMLSSGANVYFAPQNWGKVIDHAESIDGGLTTVTRQGIESEVVTTLLTNGKFQGNDARKGEVQAQIGFAALPLLHQDRRKNALVIGYGTGATSRVLHDAGFNHVDIAELSGDVVRLADTYFSDINSGVSVLPGVQIHITDGRNFLLLTRQNYDVISIEITSIWFAGAASLYNREFYQLARTKLRQDGVLQQWVQLHHMSPNDLLTIIGTLRSEFAFVSLYVVGGQGILIATNDVAKSSPSSIIVNALDTSARLKPVRELAGRTFANIANDLLLNPSQVDDFMARIGFDHELWISTDNNLKLEYSTPKANAVLQDQSFQINMRLLTSARGGS